MALPTSVSGRIKKEIIRKIDALPSVAKVYGFDKIPFDQFPVVFVKTTNMEGTFWSNAENRRIYDYRALVLFPIGQTLQNVTDDRLQEAEEAVGQVVDEIINAIDSDYELGSYALVRFVEAMDLSYNEYEYEGGFAKGAELIIRVHTDYIV